MSDAAVLALRQAFLDACRLDVAVRKPGNVSLVSAGHGMQAQHFLDSAAAAAPQLIARGRPVGARIEAAVQATWAVAGCNTNLGILLLCAPLAAAAESLMDASHPQPLDPEALRARCGEVCRQLDLDDSRAAYRAIARAHPGGLGERAQDDVRSPPSLPLQAAMALAADRDRIARAYTDGLAELFDLGWASWQRMAATSPGPAGSSGKPGPGEAAALPVAAVQSIYLAFLASAPDSHIVRKHGPQAAQAVTAQARAWQARPMPASGRADDPAFIAWDESLKAAALNPGTSADLTVASLMLAGLCGPRLLR